MKVALFDLDETLLDRSESLRDFVQWQASKQLGLNTSDVVQFTERFIELDQEGRVWKDRVYERLILEFSLKNWSVDDLLQTYVLTFCAFCKRRDGADVAINEFKSHGFKIGLVTNGKTPFQERNFKALGFEHLFDCIVVSEAVGIRKPDHAIFEFACEKVNADILTSVFVGDNPMADIKGAKESGMKTIYVPTSEGYEDCIYADETHTDLSQLIGYVKRHQYP